MRCVKVKQGRCFKKIYMLIEDIALEYVMGEISTFEIDIAPELIGL